MTDVWRGAAGSDDDREGNVGPREVEISLPLFGAHHHGDDIDLPLLRQFDHLRPTQIGHGRHGDPQPFPDGVQIS